MKAPSLRSLPAWNKTRISSSLGIEYPLQRALVKNLSVSAERAGAPELLPLWAGQSASLSRESDAQTLLQKPIEPGAEGNVLL